MFLYYRRGIPLSSLFDNKGFWFLSVHREHNKNKCTCQEQNCCTEKHQLYKIYDIEYQSGVLALHKGVRKGAVGKYKTATLTPA